MPSFDVQALEEVLSERENLKDEVTLQLVKENLVVLNHNPSKILVEVDYSDNEIVHFSPEPILLIYHDVDEDTVVII